MKRPQLHQRAELKKLSNAFDIVGKHDTHIAVYAEFQSALNTLEIMEIRNGSYRGHVILASHQAFELPAQSRCL